MGTERGISASYRSASGGGYVIVTFEDNSTEGFSADSESTGGRARTRGLLEFGGGGATFSAVSSIAIDAYGLEKYTPVEAPFDMFLWGLSDTIFGPGRESESETGSPPFRVRARALLDQHQALCGQRNGIGEAVHTVEWTGTATAFEPLGRLTIRAHRTDFGLAGGVMLTMRKGSTVTEWLLGLSDAIAFARRQSVEPRKKLTELDAKLEAIEAEFRALTSEPKKPSGAK